MRHATLAALALLFVAAVAARAEEEKKPDAIVLERPAGLDDATWERLRDQYAMEKERFLRLLAALDEGRVDYARDGLKEVLEKQQAIRRLLSDYAEETVTGMANNRLLALNPVLVRNECAPRLTGRVVRVGPDEEHREFHQALGAIRSGDRVVLGEGIYGITLPEALEDVAVVGQGPEKTTVSLTLEQARRIRIEGVKIDCRDTECVNLRRGGAVHLKNCHVFRYNSGAGGSNAVFASGAILLVEGCTFEGMSGRAAGGSGGDAFDLRGQNLLFARGCSFVNNSEIVRATSVCVFDRCSSKNETSWDFGILPYGENHVFVRENAATISNPDQAETFALATDDAAFVAFLLGEAPDIDPLSRMLADRLALRRSLPYWIGLLRHEDPSIRARAAARVTALSGRDVRLEDGAPAVPAASAEDLDRWIAELDADDFDVREAATRTLAAAGEAARERLEKVAASGTMEQRLRARRLLTALVSTVPMRPETEFARLLAWFEERRERLVWDEAAGRWTEED